MRRRTWEFAVMLLPALWACGSEGSPETGDEAEPSSLQSAPRPFALETVQGEPAIAFAPEAGLVVSVMDVSYNDFGQLHSYTLELKPVSGDVVRLDVETIGNGTPGGSRDFIAVVGGDTLGTEATAPTVFPMALVPLDAGGLSLNNPDSVVTELAYDSFGRQQVSIQRVFLGSARWRASFDNYQRDGVGRITGFVMTLTAQP